MCLIRRLEKHTRMTQVTLVSRVAQSMLTAETTTTPIMFLLSSTAAAVVFWLFLPNALFYSVLAGSSDVLSLSSSDVLSLSSPRYVFHQYASHRTKRQIVWRWWGS